MMVTGTIAASPDAPTVRNPLLPLEIRSSDAIAATARRAGLVAMGVVPAAVLAVFFIYPVVSIVTRDWPARTDSTGGSFADVVAHPRFLRIALVHRLAGGGVGRVGHGPRNSRGTPVVPQDLCRAAHAASADHRAVRAADGGCRDWPSARCSRRQARWPDCTGTVRSTPSWSRTCSSTSLSSYARSARAWEHLDGRPAEAARSPGRRPVLAPS